MTTPDHIIIDFPNDGSDFSAYYKATGWLSDKGYSYGSMCRDMPIAILKQPEILVAKWKNLTNKERIKIDGKITSNDFRTKDVRIEIY